MREILTNINTAAGGGRLAVMYFDQSIAVETQRLALNAFWLGVAEACNNDTAFTVRTVGRELEETTGVLTGEWTASTPYTAEGDATGEPVADAAQGLIRWSTGVVVGGRFLRGRTFVPGISALNVTGGNLSAIAMTQLGEAADTLATGGAGLGVWHRPTDSGAGGLEEVTGASVWDEFAVLRRRRS